MAKVIAQEVTDRYAIWNADCIDVMAGLPAGSVHLSVYSPPFAGLYVYSSSPRDLSNCRSYEEFMSHYEFVVREIHRLTLPGRMTAVHCMDVPKSNSGRGDELMDFPGDIVRLHDRIGFGYAARYHVWKEPLTVRNRTMTKGLAHATIVNDSSRCSVASADYLLVFRKRGENTVPIAHPNGLFEYAGERQIPRDVLKYKGWTGNQEARDSEDERHVHPLQLDVIDRAIVLWSNPDENVLTPFAGVGSEVYSAVRNGRRGLGAELKPSYYRQMRKNVAEALKTKPGEQPPLEFAAVSPLADPD